MTHFDYRHFIYLDTEEILNIAAMMEGGEIDEELHALTKGLGGNIGAKFGLALGASLSMQGKKEWKLRRTAYATVGKVLEKLKPQQLTPASVSSVRENTVIQCDVNLRPLRLRSGDDRPSADVIQIIRPWWRKLLSADPAVEARYQNVRRYGKIQLMQVSMFGNDGNDLADEKPLLLALQSRWILNPGEFSRRATVVGQVIGSKRPDEEIIPAHDNSGVWFEFRPQPVPAGMNKSPYQTTSPPSDISGKNQEEEAAALPSEVPIEGNRVPAGGQYSLATPEKGKGRWWSFRRRRKQANDDDKASIGLELDTSSAGCGKESRPSVALRPIMIFK